MPDCATQTTGVAPEPTVAYGRLMFASVLCMLMFGAVQVIPPVCLDALGRDLHLSFEERGRLLALRMAALMASLLVMGHFGERRGRQYLLFTGLAGIAAGQVLGARADGYHALVVTMIVSGLGLGVVEAFVNPLVAQLHPKRSAWALNLFNGLFSVGLVVGAITAGELMQGGFSWRLPFWLWTVPPLLCGFLYLTPRYPAPPAHHEEGAPSWKLVLRFMSLPLFWVLFLAMILGGGCEAGLTSWAPNYAAQVLGASARGGAWTTILYGAFMALGRFASGVLVMRLTAVRLMLISALACTVATLGLTFVPVLWGAWVLFALGGVFVACFWPTLLSVASDHIATGSTVLFSLLGAAGIVGCVLVPWAIGALGDLCGLRLAILVLPASTALLALALVASQWLVKHPHSPTHS